MTDAFYDALRASGEYPPKGWGWKDAQAQRRLLAEHFAKPGARIDPWMRGAAARLGLEIPEGK